MTNLLVPLDQYAPEIQFLAGS